jgi:hypothetical protein
VIGMGGDINTSNGQVVLDAVFPGLDLTTGGFSAWEDDTGNTASWSVTGYAICVNAAERLVASTRLTRRTRRAQQLPFPAPGAAR